MFVAGVVGFVLDNTIPGATKEQRGLLAHADTATSEEAEDGQNVYCFPEAVMKILKKCRFCKYLPFMPVFRIRGTRSDV